MFGVAPCCVAVRWLAQIRSSARTTIVPPGIPTSRSGQELIIREHGELERVPPVPDRARAAEELGRARG